MAYQKYDLEKRKTISRIVERKIDYLKSHKEDSSTKALLAKLRRSAGQEPGSDLELYGWMVEDFPEDFYREEGIQPEEWAIWIALGLFALGYSEQQSGKQELPFAKVLGSSATDDTKLRLSKRLYRISEARDIKSVAFLLRQLLGVLEDSNTPIDYSRMAADLYDFQFNSQKNRVQRAWGWEFSSSAHKQSDEKESKPDDSVQ